MNFPDESLGHHHAAESGVTQECSGPTVVGSVKSIGDLVEIISSSHSPFPVVVFEEVVAIIEFSWVSFGLFGFETVGTSDGSLIIEVITISGMRWLESLVVETWISSFSTTSFTWGLFMMNLGSEKSHLGSTNNRLLSDHSSTQ